MSKVFNDFPKYALYTPIEPQKTRNTNDSNPVKISADSAIPVSNINVQDSTETSAPKEKKGPIKTLKEFISNVKKFFATSGEYAKGTVKGLSSGAVAGSLVFTGGSIYNAVKQKLSTTVLENGDKVVKEFKKFPNKVLGIGVAVIALGYNIWKASLNASQKNAEIEHRYTGHEIKK